METASARRDAGAWDAAPRATLENVFPPRLVSIRTRGTVVIGQLGSTPASVTAAAAVLPLRPAA